MSEKKVVAVIVEGPSDENAIGGILKEHFSSEEVQFAVVHGDITSDFNTKTDNVLKKLNKIIENLRSKYGYQWKDFVRVIHLVDTDGAFTKECIQEADVDNIQYYEDHIETSNVLDTERRNEHKAEILFKLYSTPSINKINYNIFFNSCNLEHVLFGQLKDFSDEEKEEMSDEFAERYEGKVDEFIKFISDPLIAVPGAYKATWKFIEKDKNSLHRLSNMHLIFE
jgi:cupin superfamily acireductone dioxygenase involved in methionine salvage